MSAPSPADIDRICLRLLDAQQRLAALPSRSIIHAIDAAARRLLDETEPARADVLRSLTDVSGFSPPMARHILDRVCRDWLAPALDRLVHAELGGTGPLDGFAPLAAGAPRVRALAPPLGLHVFSGNVPGVAVTSIVRALIVRSAVLGKPAADEPTLPVVFAQLLREADPAVGDAVAIRYWPGGDRPLEEAALRHVSLVVHYGSAAAIADLRARAHAGIAFIEHGPRLSFAVVDASAIGTPAGSSAAARDMAHAVAMFDQQGCVSPQVVWVVGSHADARTFAASVATALADIERDLPRGRIDAGEAAAIRALRTRAEFASADQAVWGADGLAWTVILSPDPRVEGSCLNRTLIVKHAATAADVVSAVTPFAALLQTVGLHGFDEDVRRSLAGQFAQVGATRITTLAAMPWPPPEWHHDGRGPLRELIRWVDWEDAGS